MHFHNALTRSARATHIDEWIDQMQKHGADVSPYIALTLFMGVIPNDFKEQIQQDMTLRALPVVQLFEWVRLQIQYTHQEMLASHVTGQPYIHSAVRDRRSKEDEHIKAIGQQPGRDRPRRPPAQREPRRPARSGIRLGPPGQWPKVKDGRGINPWISELKGCHHCGKDHPRSQCDDYKKFLEQHGGLAATISTVQRCPRSIFGGTEQGLLWIQASIRRELRLSERCSRTRGA